MEQDLDEKLNQIAELTTQIDSLKDCEVQVTRSLRASINTELDTQGAELKRVSSNYEKLKCEYDAIQKERADIEDAYNSYKGRPFCLISHFQKRYSTFRKPFTFYVK